MTTPALRFSVGPRAITIVLAAAVVAATVLVLVPVPVVVRLLIVFPVLVGVGGWAAMRLVLGRGGGSSLLRGALSGLLGMLLLLGVVLVPAGFGVPVGTSGVGAGLVALVLLLVVRRGTLFVSGGSAVPVSLGWLVGPGIGVLAVVAAVAGAVELRPVSVDRYVQLAVAGSGEVGVPLSAPAGGRVAVGWVLRGYGAGLPRGAPSVRVAVGGGPATGVTSDVGGIADGGRRGFVDERTGSVSFVAPGRAGLYEVRVDVGASELVMQLEVRV